MSTGHRSRLCADPDCGYRALYEGSQASLSNMAAKQAGALNRVTRLRDGVITTLKQAFPAQFAAAEAQLGRRMSACDDEIVLAYVSGFLAARPAADLSPLRAVLAGAGVPVPAGDDVALLAVAVHNALAARPAAPAATTPAAAAAATASPAAAATTAAAPASAPARGKKTGRGKPASDEDLFGPSVPADPGDLWDGVFDDGPPRPVDVDDPLAGLFDEEPDALPTATAAQIPAHVEAPVAAPVESPVEAPVEAPASDEDDIFAVPEAPASPQPVPTAAPAAQPVTSGGRGPLAPRRPRTTEPADTAAPASSQPAAPPATPVAAQVAAAADPAPPARPRPAGGADDMNVRPALFPAMPARTKQPAKKAPRKAPRTAAARPDPAALDVPIAQAATGEIGEDVYNQLVAGVCIPRPVFTSDLAALVGSSDVVDAWQQRCHEERTASPVRFIGAKQRHRARGDLVIPFSPDLREAASEFTSSWWARCIDNRNMRGAKLYETAVLLHKFGEQVISNNIDDDATVLTLRLNQPRGLVGVVMLLEQRLGAGETARARLTESLEELLDGRMSLIAVLTHTAGANSLEKLSEAVREEAELRGWSRSTPVIAAHSWDFASDGGSSAVQVLG